MMLGEDRVMHTKTKEGQINNNRKFGHGEEELAMDWWNKKWNEDNLDKKTCLKKVWIS